MTWKIALGAVLLAALVPSAAQAQQVDDTDASFTLTRSGFDADVDRNIDAVANRMGGRVGLQELFTNAEQRTRALDGDPVPNALTGLRWAAGNESESDWRPQGITGSADAYPSGKAGDYQALITSWYHRPDPSYARLTLHDTTKSNANAPYRHVLLVAPTASGEVELVQSHAGGLAWVGDHLYVASTDRLLVFRLSDLIKVKPDLRDEVLTYDYILPLAGSFTGDLRFSSVSLDRTQAQPALVTSEFKENADGGRIVRFPVPENGLMGPTVTSDGAWRADGVQNIQGALMKNGRFALATSFGNGNPSALYAGAPNTTLRRTQWARSGVEDLFLVRSNDRLYTLTEFENTRRVFAVDASAHGL